MSKKLFALITGLIGVACTATTVLVNYFDPKYADQIRTICTMVPPFCADILIIFVVDDVAKKKKVSK